MATSNTNSEEVAKSDQDPQKRAKISGSIVVSSRQRGNPILKSIRLVPWEFSDTIVPDYLIGKN